MHTYTLHIESPETVQALERFVAEHPDAVMFTGPEVETSRVVEIPNSICNEVHQLLDNLEDIKQYKIEEFNTITEKWLADAKK